jgi:hypothetical protein
MFIGELECFKRWGVKDAHAYMDKYKSNPPTEMQTCCKCSKSASYYRLNHYYCHEHFK